MKPLLFTLLIASALAACGRQSRPERVPGTLFENYFGDPLVENNSESFIDFYDDEYTEED